MPRTIATPGRVASIRRGSRVEKDYAFAHARYDVYRRRGNSVQYVGPETRTECSGYEKNVETMMATVKMGDGRSRDFDIGFGGVREGDEVTVQEHRFAGRCVHDLHRNTDGTVVTKGRFYMPQPEGPAPTIIGLTVGAGLMYFRGWSFDHATMATISAGVAVHVGRWLWYVYADNVLKPLRWRAQRRTRAAHL